MHVKFQLISEKSERSILICIKNISPTVLVKCVHDLYLPVTCTKSVKFLSQKFTDIKSWPHYTR